MVDSPQKEQKIGLRNGLTTQNSARGLQGRSCQLRSKYD